MDLRPGDVIRVWDRQTRPPKTKRLICIAPERQLFLRINSEPKFLPHHRLLASESDFLEHDSYVELRQLIRPLAYDIAQAERIGTITQQQATALIAAAKGAKTLTEDHKDLIAERLSGL